MRDGCRNGDVYRCVRFELPLFCFACENAGWPWIKPISSELVRTRPSTIPPTHPAPRPPPHALLSHLAPPRSTDAATGVTRLSSLLARPIKPLFPDSSLRHLRCRWCEDSALTSTN